MNIGLGMQCGLQNDGLSFLAFSRMVQQSIDPNTIRHASFHRHRHTHTHYVYVAYHDECMCVNEGRSDECASERTNGFIFRFIARSCPRQNPAFPPQSREQREQKVDLFSKFQPDKKGFLGQNYSERERERESMHWHCCIGRRAWSMDRRGVELPPGKHACMHVWWICIMHGWDQACMHACMDEWSISMAWGHN